MDVSIPYKDHHEAANARAAALRWLLAENVMSDGSAERQFHLGADVVSAVRHGGPLLVDEGRGRQLDRMVAAQSLLLDGYTPAAMAAWFGTEMPQMADLSPAALLASESDATSRILESAAAWMA